MKKFKVLGGGCSNCVTTYNLITGIAAEKGEQIEIEKVEDFQVIMTYDIMSTPGVVIDKQVVHSGGVPTRDKVLSWFA